MDGWMDRDWHWQTSKLKATHRNQQQTVRIAEWLKAVTLTKRRIYWDTDVLQRQA
jgi:hypothetical protein